MPDEGDRPDEPEPTPPLVRRYLLARFSASMAWQMQGVAIGWYVYALTGSALDLGLVGLVQFVPFAGLALIAGHVVDRHPRRLVVMGAYALEGLCSIALAFLALSGVGSTGLVFLVVAGYGAGRAFEAPAMQSWLPTLVPPRIYPRAAAQNSLTAQTAVILGPALGGLLFLLGPSVPFLCVALLQGAAFLAARSLPGQERTRGEKLSLTTLLSGVRFIFGSELVLGAIALDLFCVLFGGATALLPIFARDILAIGPAGLGMLRSAPAVGALVMGAWLTRHPPERGVGWKLLVTIAIYGAATLVFGISHNLILSLAALVMIGGSDMLSVVIRTTLVQVAAPDAIRGRVTAVGSLFTGASNQLGQFESGVTAAWFGPVGSVVLGGAATLVIVVAWARWFPGLRRMDRLARAEEPVDRLAEPVPGSAQST